MKKKFCSCLIALTLLSSCVSLSRTDERHLAELKGYGITLNNPGDFEKPKSVGAAGALNLFLGFGNFYLGQPGYGVMNLLLWPISIVWGIPQAMIDADTINQKALIDYYNFDPVGKKYMRQIRSEADGEEASPRKRPARQRKTNYQDYDDYENYED